ncbi:MAG: peptidoglycan DD-metalloendopeptidase family protein [Reyranellaceae bacterium]
MAHPDRPGSLLGKLVPFRAPTLRELAIGGIAFGVLAVALTLFQGPTSASRTEGPAQTAAPSPAALPAPASSEATVKLPPLPALDQDAANADRAAAVESDSQTQETPANDRLDLVLRVDRGDTLAKILTDVGVPVAEATSAVEALRSIFNPRRLQIGQIITVTIAPGISASDTPQLLQMALRPEAERDVAVRRTERGSFGAEEIKYSVNTTVARHAGVIDESLFANGVAAGVPVSILNDLIKAFSYDVDFQRDIQPNDRFEIVFERLYTTDGRLAREGRVLYGELVLRGKKMAFYRYNPPSGEEDYYGVDGQSIVKALLRTPIDGAKISSRFGMRSHPILGFSRLHAGVDFAAPSGTPIYAAGNGTIEFAGVKGGYGNYVLVRHNSSFSTAYAHMKGFSRAARVGNRVRQGEVIGFVGTTGMSTGPHLHYEVHKGGRPVNPTDVSMPVGPKLVGKDLEKFRAFVAEFDRKRQAMPLGGGPQQLVDAGKDNRTR